MSVIEKQQMEGCAHKIRTFWGKLGFNVRVWIEPIAETGNTRVGSKENPVAWQVKSDMVDGLPRGFRATKENLQRVRKAINNFFL